MRAASLLDFALIENRAFMAWVRTFSSRLESRYCLAAGTIYNAFPFPPYSDEQADKLRTLAEQVFAVRKEYPSTKLGNLYDPLVMPSKLLKAHRELDAFVLKLYGIDAKATEPEVLITLINRYSELVSGV